MIRRQTRYKRTDTLVPYTTLFRSLGFGLNRPGVTSGTSLAVTRAEQGEASGIVASTAGAAYVFAPALGVWLYNVSEPLAFVLIVALCLAVLALDRKSTRLNSSH